MNDDGTNKKHAYMFSILVMILMLASGVFLYYRSLIIQKNLENNKKCESKLLRNVNQGMLFISIFLIVVPVTLAINAVQCGCIIFNEIHYMTLFIFTLFLGGAITTLGAILRGGSSDNCSDIEPSDIIWILGSSLLGFSIICISIYILIQRRKVSSAKNAAPVF